MEPGHSRENKVTRDTKRAKYTNGLLLNVEAELELLGMDSEPTPLEQFTRMEELPIECISHIFAFFTFEELNILSSICKKWQQYCWVFQETIPLSIHRRQKLRDAHLKHLTKCTQLKTLNLHGSKLLTDEGLKHISSLPKLTKLNLSFCCGITDNGAKYLKTLPNIRFLLLSYCNQLTSKSLEHISALSTLRELDLSGCGEITDEGLEWLSHLKELQKLDLSFNKITREGVELLQQSFQNLISFNVTTIGTRELPNSPGGGANWQVVPHQSNQMKMTSMYPSAHLDPRYQDIDSDEDYNA